MQRDYNTYLQDIIDAIQKIEKYTKNLSFENFLIDELIQDGVLKNLIIIGEAVKNIPEDIKIINSEIEWKKIAGLRDILIHSYFKINLRIIWDIINNKIPKLKIQLLKLINLKKE